MAAEYNVHPQALDNAAQALDAQAKRLAPAIERLSGLAAPPEGALVATGADDLDAAIGRNLDRIIEAVAGEGERLQQRSAKLTDTARTYRNRDGVVAERIDAIRRQHLRRFFTNP
jgi:hypothetical protein